MKSSTPAACQGQRHTRVFPDPQVDEDGFLLVGLPLVVPEAWNRGPKRPASTSMMRLGPAEQSDGGDAAAGWERVVPGGDCHCADGSEFAFWERRADPTKVVLFLDGGGACYDGGPTCAFTGLSAGGEANYDWSIYGEDPARDGGIFDFARADNPFLDNKLHLRAVLQRRPCTSATPPMSTRRS